MTRDAIASKLLTTPFSVNEVSYPDGAITILILGKKWFMFEMLEPTGIPDRLSDALYRWRGIAGWLEAEAVVLECIWTPDAEMPGYCNYQVLFTYPAKDGVQAGRLGINGTDGYPPYRMGDTFTLRYHPRRPSVFYYANEMSRLQRIGLLAAFIVLGVVGAFLVIGIFPK